MKIYFHKSILLITVIMTIGPIKFQALATDVEGIIDTNTTWSLASSPYNITNEVQIGEGVELTIEPGVRVNGTGTCFGGDWSCSDIKVWGTLSAIGSMANHITFNNVQIQIGDPGPEGSINIQYADMIGGSPFKQVGGGGTGNLTLLDSMLQDTSQIDISYPSISSDYQIERNLFSGAAGIMIRNGDSNNPISIKNNIFYNQATDYAISNISHNTGSPPVINVLYNSFLSTDRIAIKLDPQSLPHVVTMNAINNYWNTTDTAVIDSMTYDKNDNLACTGYIDYLPFLTDHHPDTPLPIPTANAGPDQVVFNKVILDPSLSTFIIGGTPSYQWELEHRENSEYNKIANGMIQTVSGLAKGFYDVTLTVTDSDGFQDYDSIVLAVAGNKVVVIPLN